MAAVLVTNLLFVGGAAIMLRRWRTPNGAITLLFTSVAVMLCALDGFGRFPIVLAAVVAGAVMDVLVQTGHGRWALIAGPAVLWPAWLALMALTGTMAWPANVSCGAVFLAVVSGAGLQALLVGPAQNAPAPFGVPSPVGPS